MKRDLLVKTITLFVFLLTSVIISAEEFNYQFVSQIDTALLKSPIRQMAVDDLGFLYLGTDSNLYFYDTHSNPNGEIVDILNLKSPQDGLFLINRKGDIRFAKTDSTPVRIFDKEGVLLAALGEMKHADERYQAVSQLFFDARGYYIVATSRKIIYFNAQGNFDHAVKFNKAFKIVHLDDKNYIYVLNQSKYTPEEKEELIRLDKIIADLDEEIYDLELEIKEIRLDQGKVALDIDKQLRDELETIQDIKNSPFVSFKYRRGRQKYDYRDDIVLRKNLRRGYGAYSSGRKDYKRYSHGKDIYLDPLRYKRNRRYPYYADSRDLSNLEDIREEILDLDIESLKHEIKYKDKQQEKLKLQIEWEEHFTEKNRILYEAGSRSVDDFYEMLIFDTFGELTYSFIAPNPQKTQPLYSSYLVKTDSKNYFFGVPSYQSSFDNTVLDPDFDNKESRRGAGAQVNIYSPSGKYLSKVEATPSFDGINSIAVDKLGNLYVLDSDFSRVRKFKPLAQNLMN